MSFFRNPEILKTILLYGLISILATIAAFLWKVQFGIFTLILCVLLVSIYLISTYQRYKKIWNLAADIDRILHSDNTNISLKQYSEGELCILQNEVYKMTVRLREQKQRLLDDKVYLADSIADISHQIRTPLTSINLLVQFLSEPNIGEERRIKLTHELLGMLSRIDWLITALLKISKLDAGTVQFKRETMNLCELIGKVTAPLEVPMELREQTLSIEADGTFIGDIAWTTEALTNIVKNCMEHTPIGGEIRIKATENVLYTEIVITDNGPGIGQEDLPHIFERFYKGKNSSDNSFGIGLALARVIITAQNGTIKAENKTPNGAAFIVRFNKGIV